MAKRITSIPRPTKKPAKERLTVQISVDVIDKAKNAVYWTPGLTLADLSEDALLAEVRRLERKHGAPFPKRKGELKAGRPVK